MGLARYSTATLEEAAKVVRTDNWDKVDMPDGSAKARKFVRSRDGIQDAIRSILGDKAKFGPTYDAVDLSTGNLGSVSKGFLVFCDPDVLDVKRKELAVTGVAR